MRDFRSLFNACIICKVIILLAMMLALLPGRARAGDLYLSLGSVSYHQDRSKGYNEANHGLSATYREDAVTAYSAGFFGNSLHRRAYFAAARYTPASLGILRFGALAGVVSGYDANGGGPIPVVLPAVAAAIGPVEVTVIAWPSMFGSGAGIAANFAVKVW